MSVLASTVITIVRDLIPDPVYDGSGNPLPASDGGLFRSQTLARFINDGVKALSEQMGWIVEDWTAFAVTANQPNYALDSKWMSFQLGYLNSFQLALAPEGFTLWPKAVTGGQSINYTMHRVTDHVELGLFPVPNTTDPTTTLTSAGGITATSTSMTVASQSGFLPYGYLQIDQEILFYGSIVAAAATPLIRGQCGTAAAAHAQNATVFHLSAWFKGARNPSEIALSTDTVELPNSFLYALQEYVLAKCDAAQNDLQGYKLHMDAFRQEAKRIQGDPNWRSDTQNNQTIPYGLPLAGRLAWGPWGVLVT
jgi:hypothetical protein